jgi:hypothetical protein
MRLLILGGTGFIGPHQVRYASARGHLVTIFNRGRQQEAWPGAVEELLGDRNGDLKALEGRDWDVCIDNPTTLPFWVRDAGQALKGRIKHYVFISTISVYAANDKPADETAPLVAYKGDDPMAETIKSLNANPRLYGPLKALSEKEATKQFGDLGTTIIRPSLIVGPGDETDRFTYWPVRLARGGEILAPGDGNDPVQFIDARDLADGPFGGRTADHRRVQRRRSRPLLTMPDAGGDRAGFTSIPRSSGHHALPEGEQSRPGATCPCGSRPRQTFASIAATSAAPSPGASPTVPAAHRRRHLGPVPHSIRRASAKMRAGLPEREAGCWRS